MAVTGEDSSNGQTAFDLHLHKAGPQHAAVPNHVESANPPPPTVKKKVVKKKVAPHRNGVTKGARGGRINGKHNHDAPREPEHHTPSHNLPDFSALRPVGSRLGAPAPPSFVSSALTSATTQSQLSCVSRTSVPPHSCLSPSSVFVSNSPSSSHSSSPSFGNTSVSWTSMNKPFMSSRLPVQFKVPLSKSDLSKSPDPHHHHHHQSKPESSKVLLSLPSSAEIISGVKKKPKPLGPPAASPETVTSSVGSPPGERCVDVPYGWRRLHEDDIVVYYSPSEVTLYSEDDVRQYLSAEGTCKCGLECPVLVRKTFNFDVSLPSRERTPKEIITTDKLANLCNHKRKIWSLLAAQEAESNPESPAPPSSLEGGGEEGSQASTPCAAEVAPSLPSCDSGQLSRDGSHQSCDIAPSCENSQQSCDNSQPSCDNAMCGNDSPAAVTPHAPLPHLSLEDVGGEPPSPAFSLSDDDLILPDDYLNSEFNSDVKPEAAFFSGEVKAEQNQNIYVKTEVPPPLVASVAQPVHPPQMVAAAPPPGGVVYMGGQHPHMPHHPPPPHPYSQPLPLAMSPQYPQQPPMSPMYQGMAPMHSPRFPTSGAPPSSPQQHHMVMRGQFSPMSPLPHPPRGMPPHRPPMPPYMGEQGMPPGYGPMHPGMMHRHPPHMVMHHPPPGVQPRLALLEQPSEMMQPPFTPSDTPSPTKPKKKARKRKSQSPTKPVKAEEKEEKKVEVKKEILSPPHEGAGEGLDPIGRVKNLVSGITPAHSALMDVVRADKPSGGKRRKTSVSKEEKHSPPAAPAQPQQLSWAPSVQPPPGVRLPDPSHMPQQQLQRHPMPPGPRPYFMYPAHPGAPYLAHPPPMGAPPPVGPDGRPMYPPGHMMGQPPPGPYPPRPYSHRPMMHGPPRGPEHHVPHSSPHMEHQFIPAGMMSPTMPGPRPIVATPGHMTPAEQGMPSAPMPQQIQEPSPLPSPQARGSPHPASPMVASTPAGSAPSPRPKTETKTPKKKKKKASTANTVVLETGAGIPSSYLGVNPQALMLVQGYQQQARTVSSPAPVVVTSPAPAIVTASAPAPAPALNSPIPPRPTPKTPPPLVVAPSPPAPPLKPTSTGTKAKKSAKQTVATVPSESDITKERISQIYEEVVKAKNQEEKLMAATGGGGGKKKRDRSKTGVVTSLGGVPEPIMPGVVTIPVACPPPVVVDVGAVLTQDLPPAQAEVLPTFYPETEPMSAEARALPPPSPTTVDPAEFIQTVPPKEEKTTCSSDKMALFRSNGTHENGVDHPGEALEVTPGDPPL